MIALLWFLLTLFTSPLKSKSRLEAENAALRYQLIVLRRKVGGRVGPRAGSSGNWRNADNPNKCSHFSCITAGNGGSRNDWDKLAAFQQSVMPLASKQDRETSGKSRTKPISRTWIEG